MKGDSRARRAPLIALFCALLVFAAVALGFTVRLAYLRYVGEFGRGSFSGLASLPLPILVTLGAAPLLGVLFACLLTFRAIRRAKKKEDEERALDPDRADEESDF